MKSPLLEDVNLAGARGVLVNVTASAGLKMKEYYEVMNTIKEFTADDAMVIVGTVIDEAMGDDLRVTMIATGLGGGAVASAGTKRPLKLEVFENAVIEQRTGTDGMGVQVETIDYDNLDQPAVMRKGRTRAGRRLGGRVRRVGDPGVPAQAGRLNAGTSRPAWQASASRRARGRRAWPGCDAAATHGRRPRMHGPGPAHRRPSPLSRRRQCGTI